MRWGGGAAPFPPTPFQLFYFTFRLASLQRTKSGYVRFDISSPCWGGGAAPSLLTSLQLLYFTFGLAFSAAVPTTSWGGRGKMLVHQRMRWGGGAAPSPQPPSSFFILLLGWPLLQRKQPQPQRCVFYITVRTTEMCRTTSPNTAGGVKKTRWGGQKNKAGGSKKQGGGSKKQVGGQKNKVGGQKNKFSN